MGAPFLAETIVMLTLPGAAGGVASFALAYRDGHYKNNKYKTKFTIEVVGATITATFLAVFLTSLWETSPPVAAGGFIVGFSWAKLLQVIRDRVTKIVEGALK